MSAPFNPRVHRINPYRFVISQLEEYIVYLNNITSDMKSNRAAVVNYIGRMRTQEEKNALQSNTDKLIAPATMLLSKNIPELMSKYKRLLDDALQKQSDLQKKYEHFERTGDHFAEMNEMIYANSIESALISYQNELNIIMKIYYKLNDDGLAIYAAHKVDFYHLNKKNQSSQSTHVSEHRHDASLASIKEENNSESSGGRRYKKRTLRKKRAHRKRTKRNRA
jgi:hypothetical protein